MARRRGRALALLPATRAMRPVEIAEERLDPVGVHAARACPTGCSRAGRARRRGSPRPRARESGAATRTRTRESRAGGRRAGPPLLDPVEPDPVHEALAVRPGLRHAVSRRGSFTREKSAADKSPSASIVSQRTRPPPCSRSEVPSGAPDDEREAERHRVEAHVHAAPVGRRDVRDPGGHRRDEDHLAERPDDDREPRPRAATAPTRARRTRPRRGRSRARACAGAASAPSRGSAAPRGRRSGAC